MAIVGLKSDAKNAFDLLMDVSYLILEEPLRYNQTLWMVSVENYADCETPPERFPDCGTVGCVAWWVVAAVDGMEKKDERDLTRMSHIQNRAAEILGLSSWSASELFDQYGAAGTFPQTRQHAIKGVMHIAAFANKHRADLENQKIQTVNFVYPGQKKEGDLSADDSIADRE